MKKTFIIAEIGQAHEGILHSYIDALADIKFQTHIAEYEPFRVKFSYEDNTRYDYWKRMEFTLEQWKGIKKHCDEVYKFPFFKYGSRLARRDRSTKVQDRLW
mgnify:CR=1 FL=1